MTENGASVNISSKNELSPLFCACLKGNDRSAEILIEAGAYVNVPQILGPIILKSPFSSIFKECMGMLRKIANTNKNMLIMFGLRPILMKDEISTNYLLQHGAVVNMFDQFENSPLFIASMMGYENIISL